MPATLYGTFPILLPGKTESISRNGLKRVSGTIVFLSGQDQESVELAATHGSLFPATTFRSTDKGYLEMDFDAYSTTGGFVSSFTRATDILNLEKSFASYTIREQWIVDTATEFTVIPSSQNAFGIPSTISAVSLARRMKKRVISGEVPSGGVSSLALTWITEIASISRRNFGNFDEVDIVYSQTATVT